MSITIDVDKSQTEFQPGDRISGHISWELDKEPKKVTLNLFWYTEGKGSQDVGVVDSVVIDTLNRSDTVEFSFQLPEEPYSYSGKLISICWALEAFVKKGKDKAQYELVVAPGGVEVRH